jgi:predicted DNA-binding transcriptional regulator YafY
MYHPTTRVLTVLELLQAHPGLSGAELARRLEVDRRTIRRYVVMLQDLGIPVEAERGRYGGYRLRPGFKLPPLMLTEDEALAVTLGLLAARRIGLAAAAPAVEGALAKLERVLPAAVGERVRTVQETLGFTLEPPAPSLADTTTLLALSAAAQQGRRVRLGYRSFRGEETERSLDPYGVVFHAGRWYAVGHDHLRGEVRVFRLDRVLRAEPLDVTFERPPGFDSTAHFLEALPNVPWPWAVEVLLETKLEDVRRQIPPGRAPLRQTPEGVVLATRDEDLDVTARFLVGLGCPFVVRQPPELRDSLRRLAGELAELAGLSSANYSGTLVDPAWCRDRESSRAGRERRPASRCRSVDPPAR